MGYDFVQRLSTPSVRAACAANNGIDFDNDEPQDRPSATFGERETLFIAERDSFYLASASESGWPYIQHRGGPTGFLVMLDDTTLGFADFRGNRQYITLGNIAADDRVALFLMDYTNRRRLKILAHMTEHDLSKEPELTAKLITPGYRGKPERGFTLRLEAFDWNCPQHITQRITMPEIEVATEALRTRLAVLEAENAQLRAAAENAGR